MTMENRAVSRDENKSPKDSERSFVWSQGDIRQVEHRMRDLMMGASSPDAVSPDPAADDSRHFPRLDLKLPILYKVLGRDVSHIPPTARPSLLAESANISPLGLCLSLEESVPTGTVLALSIHVVDRQEKFDAVGRVVWCRLSPETGLFLTGLRFVVLDQGSEVVEEARHQLARQLLSLSDAAA